MALATALVLAAGCQRHEVSAPRAPAADAGQTAVSPEATPASAEPRQAPPENAAAPASAAPTTTGPEANTTF